MAPKREVGGRCRPDHHRQLWGANNVRSQRRGLNGLPNGRCPAASPDSGLTNSPARHQGTQFARSRPALGPSPKHTS